MAQAALGFDSTSFDFMSKDTLLKMKEELVRYLEYEYKLLSDYKINMQMNDFKVIHIMHIEEINRKITAFKFAAPYINIDAVFKIRKDISDLKPVEEDEDELF